MATDVAEAKAALDAGRAWQAAERERRIGLTYAISGLTCFAIFGTYAAMQLAEGDLPWLVWGAVWVPFVAVAAWARRRLFRRLPAHAEDVLRLPLAARVPLYVAWTTMPWLVMMATDDELLIWPAILATFAAMYLAQAARHRDRAHALFGASVLVVAAALAVAR